MSEFPYDVLMDSLKEHNDILCRLFRLQTSSNSDIDAFFKEFDNYISKCIDQKYMFDFATTISYAAKGNNRYIKSYLTLMTKYIQKYRFYSFKVSESLDKQIFDKYFGLGLTDSNHLKISHLLKTIIDDDDVKLLAPLTEKNGFSRYNSINFNELPCVESQLSLLEACCYYGSVNCFKFLRTKFSAEITELCLQLSFLGGNPDIMSECLKCHKPDKKCMKYAIMSHNIDFVTYLMNEHNLKIKVRYCIKYDNIQAFLIRYDQTNDIEDFIVQTSDYPYVWKTIFSNLTEFDEDYHGLLYTAKFIAHHNFYYDNKDDYHFKDDSGKNILHYIAMYFTGIDIEYIFAFRDFSSLINAQDNEGKTPLHYAIWIGHTDIVKQLISKDPDCNICDNEGRLPLHYAVKSCDVKTALKIIKKPEIYIKEITMGSFLFSMPSIIVKCSNPYVMIMDHEHSITD